MTILETNEYLLEPVGKPPFNQVEINKALNGAFDAGDTDQRAIAIAGTFGACDDTMPAGALMSGLYVGDTNVPVSNANIIGVGDAVLIGVEYVVVTDKTWVDTTFNLSADASSSAATQTVTVSGGTFYKGEVILVGAEKMFITDVAGTTLVVKRAWDGSVLAAHVSTDSVWAQRNLVVERGCLGTTASAHASGLPLRRLSVPAAVQSLALAEAMDQVMQQRSGYARTIGAGEGTRNASGAGLAGLRDKVLDGYGRSYHGGAV